MAEVSPASPCFTIIDWKDHREGAKNAEVRGEAEERDHSLRVTQRLSRLRGDLPLMGVGRFTAGIVFEFGIAGRGNR